MSFHHYKRGLVSSDTTPHDSTPLSRHYVGPRKATYEATLRENQRLLQLLVGERARPRPRRRRKPARLKADLDPVRVITWGLIGACTVGIWYWIIYVVNHFLL